MLRYSNIVTIIMTALTSISTSYASETLAIMPGIELLTYLIILITLNQLLKLKI